MDKLVEKHKDLDLGAIVCVDRIVFKGHLPLNWPTALERLMAERGPNDGGTDLHVLRLGALLDVPGDAGREQTVTPA